MIRFANKNGIPCLEVQQVNVLADAVHFVVAQHPYMENQFQGLLMIRVPQYTAPSTAQNIKIVTAGVANSAQPLLSVGDANVTSATLGSAGVYLCFYDRPTNKLQLLSRTA